MVAMAFGRRHIVCVLVLCLVEVTCRHMVEGNIVFPVQHKYHGKGMLSMKELSAHDTHRHGRELLAPLEFQLGGDGSLTGSALYFTKIKIGTPPNEYHVQVDTGSDVLWVNCKGCEGCPTNSSLKINLRQYDLSASSTGKPVTCDQEFCEASMGDEKQRQSQRENCKAGMNCQYSFKYGDGDNSSGYYIRDEFSFDQVSGNLQTTNMSGSIAFGCSDKLSGIWSPSVDGIIGFGQSNASILSQLASSGKVKKKVFSHCLDGNKGGGIFAIGELVEPKLNTTPLIPNKVHYNAILKSVDVGGQLLNLPMNVSGGGDDGREAIIDSGTTLSYLPRALYEQIMSKVMSKQPNLETLDIDKKFKCFRYRGNVNDGFPVVTFHFKGSLPLPVYPSEYLFKDRDSEYCVGFLSIPAEIILLGDLVLQNKVVLYNLDDMTIGWAQHNCSSSIKVKDEASGQAYDVGAHTLAFASTPGPSASDSTPGTSASDSTPGCRLTSIISFIAALLYLLH